MFSDEILDRKIFSRLFVIKFEKYDIQLGYIHRERSENSRKHARLGVGCVFNTSEGFCQLVFERRATTI